MPSTKPLRVLLTGAAGRLGTHVRPVLRQAGHQVVPVDVQPDGNDPDFRQLDLLQEAAVREAMAGCDAVVHLGNHAGAYVRPPAQLFTENVAMTMHVFNAARTLGVRRIIYASSIQVIASEWVPEHTLRRPRIAYLPLDSDSPADPTNSYALSKRVGEMILQQWASEYPLEAASLRFPLLVGPEHHHPHPADKGPARPPSPTAIAQGFSWLSFADGAQLIAALLRAPLSGARIYLPAAPTPRRRAAMPELIEEFYRDVPRRPGDQGPLTQLVDISAVTRDTGWSPRDTAH